MKPVDQARIALEFLEDESHMRAFDALIWGLRVRRDAAAREVPEWEDLRTLASQIKEHTLSHLAHYLEMFEASAVRNGATVHWARDAHEHNQIVYDVLNARGAKHLVKSKSMLTEECDMRPFLERRGIQVTETDLGERIQQLDDQPPTHIVGPAFQKTPEQVAELFHRVYGSDPGRADPVYLAQVMREHTRPLILAADAGMTGANFAVAQTGAIVTVTERGQRGPVGQRPEAADLLGGHRENHSRHRRAGGVRPAAHPQRHRRAHHPVHLALRQTPRAAARCTSCWWTTAARRGWPMSGFGPRSNASAAARA